MNNPIPKQVQSFAVCDASGEILLEDGPEAEKLAETAPFFIQLTSLIGESMGLEEASYLQLIGKKHSTLCRRDEDHVYSALYEGNRTKEIFSLFESLEEMVENLKTEES